MSRALARPIHCRPALHSSPICPVQSCCRRPVWFLSAIGLYPWSSRLETWFGRRTGLSARPAKNTDQSITSDRLSGTHPASICYLWIQGSGDQWGHDGSSRSLCEEQRQRCEAKLSLSPRWRNRSGLDPLLASQPRLTAKPQVLPSPPSYLNVCNSATVACRPSRPIDPGA